MYKLVLLAICLFLSSSGKTQMTEEQIKAYNSLSTAEKKKVGDKLNEALKKYNNNMLAIARDAQRSNVLKMKPLSPDSINAIIKKVTREKQINLMSDFLVYENNVGNVIEKDGEFETAETYYLKANNAITKLQLSEASDLIVFYYYKNKYDYARSLFKREKFQQSLENYIEAAEFYKPDSAFYYAATCGKKLIEQGATINKLAVVENYTKAVEQNPTSYLFLRDRGIYFYNILNDNTRAIPDLTKAVEINPKAPECYMYLGAIEQDRSNFKDAITYYSKSINIEKAANVYLLRGICYESIQALASALTDYDEAIFFNPTNAKYNIYRANCNLLMKNYPDAYDDYGFATMLNPKDEASKKQLQKLDPLLKLAYEKEGFTIQNAFQFFMNRAEKQRLIANGFNLGRAVMNYYKCIQIEPKNPIPYHKAGMIFSNFEMNGPAEQFLRYAAYADGKNSGYFEDLGNHYAKNENYKAALGCFDTAVLIGTTKASTYSMMGSIKFNLKDNDGAIKAYSKSIALDPSDTKVRYMRALTYMDQLKNYQAALTDLEVIVKIYPNNQEYLQALKRCKEKLKK